MINIYGLVDPRTQELRYVGKTKHTPVIRLNEHIAECYRRKKNLHRLNWIKSLLREGLQPDIFVLEEVRKEDWQVAEKFWIAYFKMLGANLVNATIGGDGSKGYRHTAEHKKHISELGKIRFSNPVERDKQRLRIKQARENDPLIVERWKRSNQIFWSDPANVASMSAKMKLISGTSEARERTRTTHLGRKQSNATVEKKSAVMRTLWANPEYRENRRRLREERKRSQGDKK
jgi:hypothetical protein